MLIAIIIVLLFLLAASVFYILKLSKGKPQAFDAVQIATKEILNHDVGAVLIISDTDQVIYYNNEFEQLFPKIGEISSISELPAMRKLFSAKDRDDVILDKRSKSTSFKPADEIVICNQNPDIQLMG